MSQQLGTIKRIGNAMLSPKGVVVVILTAVALLIAGIGAYAIALTNDTPSVVAVEAEKGTLSAPATKVDDTAASNGAYVRFGELPATPPSGNESPSGVPMPVGNLPGWRQLIAEDFTKDAPLGSWGTTDPKKVVYTGDTGVQWREYPDGWPDTYGGIYQPAKVLSVHDGVLDYWLRDQPGSTTPLGGANPSPIIANGSQYQTYGRYTMRFRTDTTNLKDYYVAWLLWPDDDADWECAESDFPEGGLGKSEVSAFHHYGCSGSQTQATVPIDWTKWHTFTQEWMPGVRKYYLDDQLIHTSTKPVYAKPERFQMQTETKKNGGADNGHLLVDWVAVYAYAP